VIKSSPEDLIKSSPEAVLSRIACAVLGGAYEKPKKKELPSCSSGGASSRGFPVDMHGGFPRGMAPVYQEPEVLPVRSVWKTFSM
jgi:hypothetical protein